MWRLVISCSEVNIVPIVVSNLLLHLQAQVGRGPKEVVGMLSEAVGESGVIGDELAAWSKPGEEANTYIGSLSTSQLPPEVGPRLVPETAHF